MHDEPSKPPVRVRTRVQTKGGEQRLTVVRAGGKPGKRKPNSGSMKPGETRNPNGRPKGAKGSKTIVKAVLSRKTTIKDGGRTRRVPLFEALFLRELKLALDGDWRARRTILDLGLWALPEVDLVKTAAAASPETDAAIIAWFEDEIANRKVKKACHDK